MLRGLNHCNRRREEREFQVEETLNNGLIQEFKHTPGATHKETLIPEGSGK